MRTETFFDVWREYDDGVSRSWRRNRCSLIRKWALPVIGVKDLNDLEPADLVAILDCASSVKTSTRNKVVFGALRTMLRDVVMRGHLKTERFATLYARVRPLKQHDTVSDPAPLTVEQRDQVLAGFRLLHPKSFPFIAWQFFCGTRASEALGLHPDDVDNEGRLAVIRRGWVEGAYTPLKTRRSRRIIPVPAEVIELLPIDVHERIFEAIVLRSVREREWFPILSGLGIPARSLHSTRATCVSVWIDGGMTVADAAHLAGDKPSTIERHYQKWIGNKRIPIEEYAPADVLTRRTRLEKTW